MKVHAPAIVEVKRDVVDRAWLYAREIHAAKGTTLQASNMDPIEAEVVGRLCEAGLAQFLELDALEVLSWDITAKKGDGHFDLKARFMGVKKTFDVKGTAIARAERLIWPHHRDLKRMADFLVFARAAPPSHRQFGAVWLGGWINRDNFIRKAVKSDGMDGCIPGTRYMYRQHLWGMHQLFYSTRSCAKCSRCASFRDTDKLWYCPKHFRGLPHGA